MKLLLIQPSVGKIHGEKYVKSWTMEPLALSTLAGMTPDDIDIEITGLRPGEKLYEELLANGENTLPTYHDKIMISKVSDIDYTKIRSLVDELCISNLFYKDNVVQLMKEIVPE